MNGREQGGAIIKYRVYVYVWGSLIILTGLTLTAAALEFGGLSIIINILIASVKASLVVCLFMHLKYESRLFKVMLLLAMTTLTVIILLTFSDVLFR
jgi:cytochrome c oxidase subunit 4